MASAVKRGDIVWADLSPIRGNEQAGRRPVLIVSEDILNERSGTVIAMAITSQAQKAGFPLTLELKIGKLPKKAWVKISQIRTLSTLRLGKMIGHVEKRETDRALEGLGEILGG